MTFYEIIKIVSSIILPRLISLARLFSAIKINPFPFMIDPVLHAVLIVSQKSTAMIIIQFYTGSIFRKDLDDRNRAGSFFEQAGLPENDTFPGRYGKLDWQKVEHDRLLLKREIGILSRLL